MNSLSEEYKSSYSRPLVPGYDTCRAHSGAALTCKEFWPAALNSERKAKHALFECFSAVVDRANLWLKEHGNYQLLNCETAEKKVTLAEEVYNDQMSYTSDNGVSSFIKGLRLWLVPGYQCFSDTRSLQFVDVAPQCISSEVDIGGLQFETISEAVDRFNDQIKRNPLPGHIITVETVSIAISREKWDGTINTEECRWIDLYKRHRFNFLRVFYVNGSPAYENIGLADFVPEQVKGTSSVTLRPRFAGFDTVMEQAATWISKTEGVRITNVQTIETKYWKRKELESGRKVNTLEAFESKIERRARLFLLRVVYVRPVEGDGAATVMESPPDLSCKTFRASIEQNHTCCGVVDLELEGLEQTVQHIAAWLTEGGCTPFGAHLISIPQWFMEKGDMAVRSVYNGDWYLHKNTPYKLNLMYLVRVYIKGPYRTAGPDYFGSFYNPSMCCRVQ